MEHVYYDSILKLLKLHKKVTPNINTRIIQSGCKLIIKNKDLYLIHFNLTMEDFVLYTLI